MWSHTNSDQHRVLCIGGASADAQSMRELLYRSSGGDVYEVDWAATLADGMAQLADKRFDAVLFDVQHPDVVSIQSVSRLVQSVPAIPVLVVVADDNEERARELIRAGASDCLLLNRLDDYWLPRAIEQAVERKLSEDSFVTDLRRVAGGLNSREDAMISTDAAGLVTELNAHAERLTGWSAADAAGRP